MGQIKMKIGMVSLIEKKSEDFIIPIIKNNSDLNLILFPGYTVKTNDILNNVMKLSKLVSATILLELFKNRSENGYYIINNGKKKGPIKQRFFTASQSTKKNVKFFLELFQKKRIFDVKGKKFGLIICGESNIIICRNQIKPDFRHFRSDFEELFSDVDVFLNPMHEQLEDNYRFYKKRLEYLSKGNKAAFITNNAKDNKSLNRGSLQYAYSNSKALGPLKSKGGDNYKITTYKI